MPGEIRQNLATRQWVIFAPDRSQRPRDQAESQDQAPILPAYDPDCPFCPGNEDKLTPIRLQMPGRPWSTRVVPNKFPALEPDFPSEDRIIEGPYISLPNFGYHEVIIENPRHNLDLWQMPDDSVTSIMETYHRRFVQLSQDPDLKMVLIFRNHGQRAGTSLQHPHSQLVATPVMPRYVRIHQAQAQDYYDQTNRCVTCHMLEIEQQVESRVVASSDQFLAFVPYAAQVPYEVWIAPKYHQATFALTSETERRELGAMLKQTLAMLSRAAHKPDYNFILDSAGSQAAKSACLHWSLQIRPRTVTRAGFEIGSGMRINPHMPSDDARQLRGQS